MQELETATMLQQKSKGCSPTIMVCVILFCLQKIPGAVNSNQIRANKLAARMGRVLEMMLRGPACFDFERYLKANPDLLAVPSREHLWMQFLLEDQFNGRKFW